MTASCVADCADRVYRNEGNPEVLMKVCTETRSLLDVGCGAGDNARLIRKLISGIVVDGITASSLEQFEAQKQMRSCVIADIEGGPPRELLSSQYDCILFSHILEHLRNPARVLADFLPLLKNGGQLLIAVPNITFFKWRWQLALGRFEYAQSGVFDNTHLRFFTYHSADRMLLAEVENLKMYEKSVTGSVPLWIFRRHLLTKSAAKYLDGLGARFAPNLFGDQIILDLRKRDGAAGLGES